MIKLISILGSLAVLAQMVAVLWARHTALTWQGTETAVAVGFCVIFLQPVAIPVGFVGLLLGLFGVVRRNHWGRRRALLMAMTLCVLGMIPVGLLEFTWRGAMEARAKAYQATQH